MNDIIKEVNKNNGFVLRKYKDPEFNNFDRPLSFDEFYEIEHHYGTSKRFPKNGWWCGIVDFKYIQDGKEVKVYFKLDKIEKY